MNDEFPIKVKRLRSARTLRLRVLENGSVVVTCPIRLPQRYIDNFISEHSAWIYQKQTAAKQQQHSLTENRETLFFRGQEYQFRLDVTAVKKPVVAIEQDRIIVTSPSEEHTQVRAILEKWYRQEAQTRFKKRVPLLADLVNCEVSLVSIRSQRSRWGSCSSRGTISLNWRLIMAPDTVSDYVLYHELAHRAHMNHSPAFWRLVGQYVPDYKKAEQWLKDHHRLLQF